MCSASLNIFTTVAIEGIHLAKQVLIKNNLFQQAQSKYRVSRRDLHRACRKQKNYDRAGENLFMYRTTIGRVLTLMHRYST